VLLSLALILGQSLLKINHLTYSILKLWYITDEINRTRVEGRELQLKYREMPEKEARFNCIEHDNHA
jgi:hypothetical protein